MKLKLTIALIILIGCFCFAQQGINYKAVVKDGSGAILATTPVSIRFTIYEGAALTNAVYQETHTPTTDAKGIVIINIGEGILNVMGVFNNIDWGSDDHFLNTKINAGAGIVDLGTTAFKSVPYALYAETAGSATEAQTLADVIALGNSANGPITGLVTSHTLQSASHKGYVDDVISFKQTNLETQITDLLAQLADYEEQILEVTPASIGDMRKGGVVFWVDPEDNAHGLACSLTDQSSGIQWYNDTYVTIGTTYTEIGLGSYNTYQINVTQGLPYVNYASGISWQVAYGGLPSIDELQEMYLQRATINSVAIANGGVALSTGLYWSSSEFNNTGAYMKNFSNGVVTIEDKANTYRVRAIIPF